MSRDDVTLLIHCENIVIVTRFDNQFIVYLANFLGYGAVINLFVDIPYSIRLGRHYSVNNLGSVVFVEFSSHHFRLEKAGIIERILNLTL